MIQTIIVIAIVLLAVFFVVRRVIKGGDCGCGCCDKKEQDNSNCSGCDILQDKK
ncbi:hypothetical protein [Endomicrobium proavitum]|uniref:hypothetical protein n=1 Tax=Endomicrobium proavitum TaxID=1408281 RepID=UPI00130D8C20|nr:hypothetical protein [Endomicrobium proavitum]